MSSQVRILGIAGSLRRGSYNQAALRAAKLDFIKVCRVSWPTDLFPSDGGAYAQL